jgi:hypothetical protein
MNEEHSDDPGQLYDADHSNKLEALDRQNPIPGGEPDCPVCGAKTARFVESHHAPATRGSAFRVRLVCSNPDCRRWTVYDL